MHDVVILALALAGMALCHKRGYLAGYRACIRAEKQHWIDFGWNGGREDQLKWSNRRGGHRRVAA
jgi:hypothetical protein